jgi:hypothetical protein
MSPAKFDLTETDKVFDPSCDLVQRPALTPGYHTRLAPGTPAHSTRESIDYALWLLDTDEPWRHERASRVLAKILSLQDIDPTSIWFGLWGWFYEEPPPEMNPADWNWADFIGAKLAEIIARHPDKISPALLDGSRAALSRAAWCIFRRNVQIDYTNIGAMGAAVCLMAGEMLGQPLLFDYGLQRLRNLHNSVETHGGFWEYNSSTYTLVALVEFERILALVRNPDARCEAEALVHHAWRLIGGQFHPGTGQWAGPACRSYNDWLDEPKIRFLEQRLGFPLVRRPTPDIGFFGDAFAGGHPIPCPPDLRERFRTLPSDPHVNRNCWVRAKDGSDAQVSTTWFSDDATLGSMNRENTWVQGRVVLGYWRSPQDPAIRLRLRLLHNGRDFASGLAWNDQDGPRLLTSAHFITGRGDFHPTLNAPPDGTFQTRDLRLRYELEGHGLQATTDGHGRFVFSAGPRRAAFTVAPGWFDGMPTGPWRLGGEGEVQWLELIFYTGPERAFHPALIGETGAAVALELLGPGETASSHGITSVANATHRTYTWKAAREHHVSYPLKGGPRPWP